jgi:hypothetical protein
MEHKTLGEKKREAWCKDGGQRHIAFVCVHRRARNGNARVDDNCLIIAIVALWLRTNPARTDDDGWIVMSRVLSLFATLYCLIEIEIE